MIANRRGRKPNSGKLSFDDLNCNRELAGAGTSRFQILAQVPDEFENPVHAAFTDIPSTLCQPFIPTSNPTFTSKRETTAKTLARHKPHTKAMAAKTQSRKPNQASSNQYVSPLATTLDPTKCTVVFCSSQTLVNGDVREVATEHRERQGPDPQHLADPLDAQNSFRVKEVGNTHTHPAVPMSGVDEDGMAKDSMVQETPLPLMDDATGQ
ncbi:hypothetical protein WN943_018848 [Citrus x changshan-huyou]